MKSKALLASILFLTIALAGCASGNDKQAPVVPDEPADGNDPDETPGGDTGNTGNTGNGGSTGNGGNGNAGNTAPNTTNTPPVASLVASATNGTAPLNVTFTLDGSDADGDALTWTLSVDGEEIANGTALPADVSQVLQIGNHTATVALTDGAAFANETINIAVAGQVDNRLVFTGDVSEDCQMMCGGVCDPVLFCYAATGAIACESFRTGEPGKDCLWFALPAAAAGQPFVITSTAGDPDAEFRASCDVTETDPATQAGTILAGDNQFASSGSEAGTVPAGLPCVVIWEWEPAAPSTITMLVG